MPRQAIQQATCTECDDPDDENEYMVLDSTLYPSEDIIAYDVRCSCGEDATITIDTNGVAGSNNVSFEDASWNQEDDEHPEE